MNLIIAVDHVTQWSNQIAILSKVYVLSDGNGHKRATS